MGNLTDEQKGEYHIADFGEFKKQGALFKIAIGNSRVVSGDEIKIRVKASDIKFTGTVGAKNNVYMYDVFGISCKAFEPMIGEYFDVYLEYTDKIDAFIRKGGSY